MKISTSGPNSSLPPPINWVTKPKPSPANTINHSPEHVEESETPARRLVPIFINPNHIPDLKEALQCLSESPHRQAKLVLQADTIIDDDGNIKRIFLIDSRQSQQEDSDAHAEDLASTFSHLSMSTPSPKAVTPASMNSAQSPLGMRTAPVTNSGKSPRTSTMKRRYYVVLVGKCAGIYYDEWQVFYYFVLCHVLLTLFLPGKTLNLLSVMCLTLATKDFPLTSRQRSFTLMQNRWTRLELSGTLVMMKNMDLSMMQYSSLVENLVSLGST